MPDPESKTSVPDQVPSPASPGSEIYPMPFFVLLVAEHPSRLASWYIGALGFATIFEIPQLFHLRRHKYQDLLVVPAGAGRIPTTGGPFLYLDADGELEALAEHLQGFPRTGSMAVSDPVSTPWNTCELRIVDPQGHRLVLTSRPANPDPEVAAKTRAMLGASLR
jgi:hypothetical protein